jgi:hypothetical protein
MLELRGAGVSRSSQGVGARPVWLSCTAITRSRVIVPCSMCATETRSRGSSCGCRIRIAAPSSCAAPPTSGT